MRPLSIGEILDRAIALLARNAPLFGALLLVYALPIAIIRIVTVPDAPGLWRELGTLVTHWSPAAVTVFSRTAQHQPHHAVWLAGVRWIFDVLLGALTAGAVVAGVAAVYRNGPATFASAYRTALQRFWTLAVVGIVGAAVFFIAFVAVVVLTSIGAVILGLILHAAHVSRLTTAIVLVLIVLPVLAVAMLALAPAFLAWQIAFVAAVLEDPNPVRALERGVRLVFARTQLVRAWLAALTLGVMVVGVSLVAGAGEGLLAILTNSTLVAVAYSAIVGLVGQGIFDAFLVLYYFDARVRREGAEAAGAVVPVAP